MALTGYTDYLDKLESASSYNFTKNSITTAATYLRRAFTTAPFGGSAPGGTARTCDSTTAGALFQKPQLSARTLQTWLASMRWSANSTNTPGFLLVDRLADVSGASSTLTGSQGLAISSAALPARLGGNYDQVRIAMELWGNTGGTNTTFTVGYSDETATARTSPTCQMLSGRVSNDIFLIPFGAAHKGVSGVSTINFDVSTGTAGNVGLTLYKPICYFPSVSVNGETSKRDSETGFNTILDIMMLPEVYDDACLDLWVFCTGTSSGVITGCAKIIEA